MRDVSSRKGMDTPHLSGESATGDDPASTFDICTRRHLLIALIRNLL